MALRQRRKHNIRSRRHHQKREVMAGVLVSANSILVNAPDPSSIAALKSNPRADGISLSEAILAANMPQPGFDRKCFSPRNSSESGNT